MANPISRMARTGRNVRWRALYETATVLYGHGKRMYNNLSPAEREQEEVVAARGLVYGEQPRCCHDAPDRGHRPRDGEDRDADSVDPDSRAPRRLRASPDGEDMAAEAGALGHVLHAGDEGEEDEDAPRHAPGVD